MLAAYLCHDVHELHCEVDASFLVLCDSHEKLEVCGVEVEQT